MTTVQIRTLSSAILLAALVSTTSAFQPDGKPTVYKPTIDRLQEQLVLTPPATVAVPVPVPAQELSTIPLVDDGPAHYWFHPKIHTFGNIGLLGALHAGVAPLATKLIDVTAYDGENVRNQIARELSHSVVPFPTTASTTAGHKSTKSQQAPKIVDLACGVGISTRALQKAFPHAVQLVGIDTSPEMINMAKSLSNPKSWASQTMEVLSDWLFRANDMTPPPVSEEKGCDIEYNLANAEETGLESETFDLATIMYCFHEAPYWGRSRILQETHRLLAPGATLVIVDISPTYKPSFAMLAGEPYVLEYQENIQLQLKKAKGFQNCRYREVVEGHVGLWLMDREE
jgi:SAM-dependent methyltransferase